MDDLTPERIAELKRIAEAATQGEWDVPKESPQIVAAMRKHVTVAGCGTSQWVSLVKARANAAHIAAFDPPTVLALIAALTAERERAEKAESERDEALAMFGNERSSWSRSVARVSTERDALRAQVERLRSAIEAAMSWGTELGTSDPQWIALARAALKEAQ